MENQTKKNILLVGSGAVAVALAKKLSKLDNVDKIYVAPSNGIESSEYSNIDIREDDSTGLLKFVLENDIHLTIPTSEKSLRTDIVSFFLTNGQNVFGPTKDACDIALSKTSCKRFLYKIHAQTSKFGIFDKFPMAQDWLKNAKFPITIKCNEYNSIDDRLVCPTISLAREFLDNLFSKNEENVLIEEYTYGHNFTLYYVTDGYSALPITAIGNYKFSQDGDGGLLTNGVGCYAPDFKVSQTVFSRLNNVVHNILVSLDKKGAPYIGLLGVDCTLTDEEKFYVNEFKPFLQNHDCDAVLNLIEDDLMNIFMACIEGLFADEYVAIKTNDLSSVSVVTYSSQSQKNITGLEKIDEDININFINSQKSNNGTYYSKKGEMFVITKTASTLGRAKKQVYESLSSVSFEGLKYRKDILKEYKL